MRTIGRPAGSKTQLDSNPLETHTRRHTMQALTRTRKLNHDSDRYGRRQPRPMARRTGTRAAIVRAALMEG